MISTASAANHEYVRGLGADMVIDYRSQDFTRLIAALPLCEAAAAHRVSEARHLRGKLVLQVR